MFKIYKKCQNVKKAFTVIPCTKVNLTNSPGNPGTTFWLDFENMAVEQRFLVEVRCKFPEAVGRVAGHTLVVGRGKALADKMQEDNKQVVEAVLVAVD